MPPALVAFLFASGISTWVYTKLMRTTGNNTKSSIIATSVIFIFSFFVFWAVFSFITGLNS